MIDNYAFVLHRQGLDPETITGLDQQEAKSRLDKLDKEWERGNDYGLYHIGNGWTGRLTDGALYRIDEQGHFCRVWYVGEGSQITKKLIAFSDEVVRSCQGDAK